MQGLRTTLYRVDGLRLHISADSVRIAQPRVLGPFRIGFVRSLTAVNVVIEAFGGGDLELPQMLDAERVADTLAGLQPQGLADKIASAELAPVKLSYVGRDGVATVLEGLRCTTRFTRAEIVCEDGRLRHGARVAAFGRATYDGHRWQLDRSN